MTARWRAGRAEWLQLHGWSMAPALRHGDWLKVAPLDGAPRPGEVVAFLRNGRIVAHRVISADGARVITRGDSVGCADAPTPTGELLGRIVEVKKRSFWRRAA